MNLQNKGRYFKNMYLCWRFEIRMYKRIDIRSNSFEASKRALAAFLLALFVYHVASTGFFWHTHIINGRYIIHSHLYPGTASSPGHEHSTAQFQLIDVLSLLLAMGISVAMLSHFLRERTIVRIVASSYFPNRLYLLPYSLRAPPAC